MEMDLASKISNIFVGRKKELTELTSYWRMCQNNRENKGYVLLNAPGVGKTTLLNKFGESILEKEEGIFLKFRVEKNYETLVQFNNSLFNMIFENYTKNFSYMKNYIDVNHKDNEFIEVQFSSLKNKILSYKSSGKSIKSIEITHIIKEISSILPLFLMIDEVQELQKQTFINRKQEEETYLHHMTEILSNLLDSKVFMVLSGTRYHILSQIGYGIGSPIKGKIVPIIISNLKADELEEYIEIYANLIKIDFSERKEDIPNKFTTLIQNLSKFILGFSGGHGRTLENIINVFSKNINMFTQKINEFSKYPRFMEFMIEKTYDILKENMISKEIEYALLDLSSYTDFPIIKSWIDTKIYSGFKLGNLPHIDENFTGTRETLKEITYTLMNIGIIFRNGDENYYISSYFHLLKFFEVFDKEHNTFLGQVLNNRFFKLMCGSHSGFGYTFEQIFASSLFLLKRDKTSEISKILHFDPTQIGSVENIPKQFNWSNFKPMSEKLLSNILFSCPAQKAVDLFIIQNNTLVLIQITTEKLPKLEKLRDFKKELENISKQTKFMNLNISGCFVSLFELTAINDSQIKIISKNELMKILGSELYTHLINVKMQL